MFLSWVRLHSVVLS